MCGIYSSHIRKYVFGYCLDHGICVLDGCDDYIICTTNCFIQISLESKKSLFYKHFTEILNFWYSCHDHLENSLQILSVLFKFILPELFNSVWKDWSTIFRPFSLLEGAQHLLLYFPLRSFFFAMPDILSTPLFWWLKGTALLGSTSCHHSEHYRFFYLKCIHQMCLQNSSSGFWIICIKTGNHL